MPILGAVVFPYLRTSVNKNLLKQKLFYAASTSSFIFLKCGALPYSTAPRAKQKYPSYFYKDNKTNKKFIIITGLLVGYCLLAGGLLTYINNNREQKMKERQLLEKKKLSKFRRAYTAEEVAKHPTWTIYKGGVYDFEKYDHPGGQELLKEAGGGSLEPYWEKYNFHNDPEILKKLKSLKIGDLLSEEEAARCRAVTTVPKANLENYRLELVFSGTNDPKDTNEVLQLTMNDIMSLPKFSIVSSIPCQNDPEKKEKEGSRTWAGTRFIDIVDRYGIDLDYYESVSFECLDRDRMGIRYRTKVPVEKINPNFDILLAYELNGEDIPLEQGYPVRVVIPDLPAGKNVKWLYKIIFTKKKYYRKDNQTNTR